MSGLDARRMTSIVERRKAIRTARSGPSARTLSRQTAAIQNSERRIRQSSRSSWTSISDSTAFATIPASAAFGRKASMSVKKSMTTAIVTAATRLGSWLFEPEASIAAEREGLLPVRSDPVKPAARLAAPQAKSIWSPSAL